MPRPKITLELLHRLKSKNGGYTRESLAILEVPWPPKKGWRRKLMLEAKENFARDQMAAGQVTSPLQVEAIKPDVKQLLLRGTVGLRNPPYHQMNDAERLLHVALCAYRKHVMNGEDIGWDELGDWLHNAICQVIGDDEFVKWSEGPWE